MKLILTDSGVIPRILTPVAIIIFKLVSVGITVSDLSVLLMM